MYSRDCGVACDATRTTGGMLASIFCALRRDWGKAVKLFAKFRTLIMFKFMRIGYRAQAKSRLGSNSPLNCNSKDSVRTAMLTKFKCPQQAQQANRVHTEVEYSIH